MSRIAPIKGGSDGELDKMIIDESLPIIHEALNLLLEKKPKDGMSFLADFFLSKVQKEETNQQTLKKKKRTSSSMVTKSVSELDKLIEEHNLSATTIQNFFSKNQEDRARAGLAILTSENQKILETIVDTLTDTDPN
jgi:hypothetical protein